MDLTKKFTHKQYPKGGKWPHARNCTTCRIEYFSEIMKKFSREAQRGRRAKYSRLLAWSNKVLPDLEFRGQQLWHLGGSHSRGVVIRFTSTIASRVTPVSLQVQLKTV